nr:hypothetical protein [Tanacetum cinerariifolium]
HLNTAAIDPSSLGYSILEEVPHNVYNKAHQRLIDHIDKSHEDPHSGHNKDTIVEDSINHMDKNYSFHCSPVLTHNEVGTEDDNHYQIENHFHMNHTSKSRMWGVEGGKNREGSSLHFDQGRWIKRGNVTWIAIQLDKGKEACGKCDCDGEGLGTVEVQGMCSGEDAK